MRVNLIVNSFPTFSETFLFNLVVNLERRGIEVFVFATSASRDTSLYESRRKEWTGKLVLIPIKINGVKTLVECLTLVLTNPLYFAKCIRKYRLKKAWFNFASSIVISQNNPDIIHFAFSGIAVTFIDCIDYWKRKSIGTVVSCRGSAEKVRPLIEPKRKELLITAIASVDSVHCVSKDMLNTICSMGANPRRAFINYPSIDVELFKNLGRKTHVSNREFNIITIGRLHFQKGYVYALQCMKKLAGKKVNFKYHIVGDGPDHELVVYLINELGLSNNVILHGKKGNMDALDTLSRMDVFLLPSLYEGIANAALEAMALEIPVVSTRAGGMNEVIQHGVNGLLTDWQDVEHMADQIFLLKEQPEMGNVLARNARKTLEQHFTFERQTNTFIDEYQKLYTNS